MWGLCVYVLALKRQVTDFGTGLHEFWKRATSRILDVGRREERAVDISWNEAWTGTTVIRDFKKEGDKLVYTTRPASASADRKDERVHVWEKVK